VSDLSIAEVASYLAATGWRREAQAWRTASIWISPDDHEVLLPARDGMGDGDLRLREVLDALAKVENRPRRDIAEEIGAPLSDIQTYQMSSEDQGAGFTALPNGVRAMNGVRQLIDCAGRAYLDGPHVAFRGNTPLSLRQLLGRTRLSPGSLGGSTFRVHVPIGMPPAIGAPAPFETPPPLETPPELETPLGRGISVQLHDAIGSANAAAAEATGTDDLSGFDDAVMAGVSANLCAALSDLGGQDREQPFSITFTWARGLASALPPATIQVDAGRGAVLAAGARHLRRLSSTGEATVTGLIESLHDDAPGGDRWRVKVRGSVAGARGVESRRALWVRLDSRAAYDLAIQAHRERQAVRAQGMLAVAGGRLELLTGRSGFGPLA